MKTDKEEIQDFNVGDILNIKTRHNIYGTSHKINHFIRLIDRRYIMKKYLTPRTYIVKLLEVDEFDSINNVYCLNDDGTIDGPIFNAIILEIFDDNAQVFEDLYPDAYTLDSIKYDKNLVKKIFDKKLIEKLTIQYKLHLLKNS